MPCINIIVYMKNILYFMLVMKNNIMKCIFTNLQNAKYFSSEISNL